MRRVLTLKDRPRFHPQRFADLKLWLDASDASTITSSSNLVSQWNDKSGNANHATQGTGANQPLYVASAINAKSAIDFDGNNDSFVLPAAVRTAITKSTDHTMFYVFKSAENGASIFRNIINAGQGGAGADMLTISIRSDDLRVGYYNGTAYNSKSTAFSDAANPHILSVSHSANSAPSCLLDGTTMSGTNTPAGNTEDAIKLGGETQDNAKNFSGKMAEIIIYSRILSISEISKVNRYLSKKWGVVLS